MSTFRQQKFTPEEAAASLHATATKHPLIGFGVHWKDADGCVTRQGTILDVFQTFDGELVLLQLFEWLMGCPSVRVLIRLSDMTSSNLEAAGCVLYASPEEMNDHYERVDYPRNEAIREQRAASEK